MQPMSALLLEQFVFSKPYFDPAGLIIATADREPVGFVHAGFGANQEEDGVDYDYGTTYVMMLRPDHRNDRLADGLLAHAESYLRERGAKVFYGGGVRPINGFYLGLYGGSELAGVLSTDPVLGATCQRSGYREIDRVIILQRELASFRQPVTRDQRMLRREVTCTESYCPLPQTWWEACTTGAFERIHFSLEQTASQQHLADVWFWDIEPLSSGWGVPTAGMYDLHVESPRRRQGRATFLISEAFARLKSRGIMAVEAQTMHSNAPALAFYQKLGFDRLGEGMVYRKS